MIERITIMRIKFVISISYLFHFALHDHLNRYVFDLLH